MATLRGDALAFAAFSTIALGLSATQLGCANGSVSLVEGSSTTGDGGSGGQGGAGGEGGDGGSGGCITAEHCAALSGPCVVGTCVNGACEAYPANELGACDDGIFCTDVDTCNQGVCSGTLRTCPSSDPCNVGQCDFGSDTCVEAPGNDGASCSDGDACTTSDSCKSGVCAAGSPVDCSFLNGTCSVGTCDPAVGCVAQGVNDGTACDDSLFCTINDVCTAGVCAGAPNTCAAPGNICLIGTCNEAAKSCTTVVGNNGLMCDDGSTCTTGETCAAGVCGGGAPANAGGACDDGNLCSSNDKCAAGACAGTPISACVNGDGCCPMGCDNASDDDCNCTVNLAPSATAAVSPGGGNQAPFAPSEMNNGITEPVCQFAWVSNGTIPAGAWAELSWPSPVTIGSIYVETDHATMPICGSAGRNIESAVVQTWNGASWVTATSWANQLDDVQIDIFPPVTTSKIRLFDMTASPGNGNSQIFEWYVYQGPGCFPP